ncbi:MAG: hypothetical protein KDJ44_11585 [Rhodoblastus sp.]|nr:hypothetical protein [Rhodoblastus sp.]
MTNQSRRSFLLLTATAIGATAFAADALAQVYYEERVRRRRRRRRYVEPDDDDGPDEAYCQPMCAEDLSPCDSPTQKAADGRCSSPTAGSVR